MKYAILLLFAALGYQLLASSSSKAASHTEADRGEPPGALAPDGVHRGAPGSVPPGGLSPRREHRVPRTPGSGPGDSRTPGSEPRGALARADGAVPDGTTVFDDEVTGVANLDPALLRAVRRAATDAADDGVEFFVNSGWRSPQYQEPLLHEAVSTYGAEREAARWVATPNTSAHVSGDAVDVGFAATVWLSRHGAEYGLCQIYRNELGHYELRREAVDHGCPPMFADPTHDPLMQQ